MSIVFNRGWRRFKTGDSWSPPDGVATTLIRRGIAKEAVVLQAAPSKRKADAGKRH